MQPQQPQTVQVIVQMDVNTDSLRLATATMLVDGQPVPFQGSLVVQTAQGAPIGVLLNQPGEGVRRALNSLADSIFAANILAAVREAMTPAEEEPSALLADPE